MKPRLMLPVFLVSGLLLAHPMGNFSVSHYSRIEVTRQGAQHPVRAGPGRDSDASSCCRSGSWSRPARGNEIERHAVEQARAWSRNLKITVGGKPAAAQFERAEAGARPKAPANMPIMRVTAELHVEGAPGTLTYEDTNYPDRAGWKEIVIGRRGRGSRAHRRRTPIAAGTDGLSAGPSDRSAAGSEGIRGERQSRPAGEHNRSGSAAAGTRPEWWCSGDFLSRLLHQGEIGWGMMLVGMVVAFGLGAVHALSPGHGKTIVAAYLVGAAARRSTPYSWAGW